MNLEIPGYSITRSIGNGGMTKLYVALDPQQNRYVIRVLNADCERDRKSRKRFRTGAEVLRAMHTPKPHPNIVRLVKTGVENGRSYMVLQYVESRTLRDLILNRDPVVAQNPIVFIRQLARVIQYVHAKGFLHLDIKPENLLIRPDGRLVLIDFDLAVPRKRFFKKLPSLAGTTAYMPPEMLATRIADDRSDVYAFGVTCYEMLTFHKPFEGEKIEQVQAAQVDPAIPPTPIRQHNPAAPAALSELVMKCIAKKPEDRYPDMVLVLRDLDRLS
jgi:serine/threonine protein kinase